MLQNTKLRPSGQYGNAFLQAFCTGRGVNRRLFPVRRGKSRPVPHWLRTKKRARSVPGAQERRRATGRELQNKGRTALRRKTAFFCGKAGRTGGRAAGGKLRAGRAVLVEKKGGKRRKRRPEKDGRSRRHGGGGACRDKEWGDAPRKEDAGGERAFSAGKRRKRAETSPCRTREGQLPKGRNRAGEEGAKRSCPPHRTEGEAKDGRSRRPGAKSGESEHKPKARSQGQKLKREPKSPFPFRKGGCRGLFRRRRAFFRGVVVNFFGTDGFSLPPQRIVLRSSSCPRHGAMSFFTEHQGISGVDDENL